MDTARIPHDGRTLELHTSGDPHAPCVLLLHAAPGGGDLDPDPEVTARHGVFLVGVDRPGYGGSSPFAAGRWPSVAVAADDAVAVLDHLGVTTAAVAGWSAGGRVAMAAAARSPGRLTRVAALGTPAPQRAVPWVPPGYQQTVDDLVATGDADRARAGLAEVMGDGLGEHDGEGWLRSITTPADTAVLDVAAHRDRLAASTGHGMAPGIHGMSDDVLAYCGQPWGFEPADVRQPALLVYGEGDDPITVAHGEWYAARLPDARVLPVPDVGHLMVVTAWDAVLRHLTG